MNEPTQPGVKHVIGPDGRRLTLADLPSPDTKRWVIRRKAEVVAAVRGGLLSLEEACSRYTLNPDEFLSWQYCIDRYGLAGLRTTRTQFYITNVAWLQSSSCKDVVGCRCVCGPNAMTQHWRRARLRLSCARSAFGGPST